MLSKRVVRLDHEEQRLYKVVTNPVGFINHFTGLQTTPNCQLVLKEGMPLGEHCLVVKSTKVIKAGKQWLLNYGPLHQCGERVVRKRRGASGDGAKAKKIKRQQDEDANDG